MDCDDTRSSNVIKNLKSIFARHGIPEEVMSDCGPQFSCYEFKKFSKEWEFKHTTSSPYYPRSNGMVERSIKTIKDIFKRTTHDGRDVYLALLAYRNTPVYHDVPSPAEILMSRRLRSTLPMTDNHLMPKIPNIDQIRTRLQDRQEKQKYYYDRGTKNLKELHEGDTVLIKNLVSKEKDKGTILSNNNERSYKVKLETGTITDRNRFYITPLPAIENNEIDETNNQGRGEMEEMVESCKSKSKVSDFKEHKDLDKVSTTSSGRLIKKPNRLDL